MNPHEVLGVPHGASADEVKAAYRAKCLEHHPDLAAPGQRRQAEARFRAAVEAYERLQTGSEYIPGQAETARGYEGKLRLPTHCEHYKHADAII